MQNYKQHVGPDLFTNCLQMSHVSADDTSSSRGHQGRAMV